MDIEAIRSRRQIDTRSGRDVTVSIMDEATLINGNSLLESDVEGQWIYSHFVGYSRQCRRTAP